MVALGLDERGRAARLKHLYENTLVDVRGRISNEHRVDLRHKYKSASATARYKMEELGLYPTHYGTNRLVADSIPPGRGFIGGYTDGESVSVNTYGMPGTTDYCKFMNWLGRKRDMLGRYLYEKFGTSKRADESLFYTIGHEVLHTLTQLNNMKTRNGKKMNFRQLVFSKLMERYESKLNKGLKWLAPLFAHISERAVIEGINEVATENVYYGKPVSQIIRERGEGKTYYDKLAFGAAGSLNSMNLYPGKEAMQFYEKSAQDPRFVDYHLDRNPNVIKIGTMKGQYN